MTNVKFSELGLVESAKKIKNKKICEFNLILKSDNSFDFNQQIYQAFFLKYFLDLHS